MKPDSGAKRPRRMLPPQLRADSKSCWQRSRQRPDAMQRRRWGSLTESFGLQTSALLQAQSLTWQSDRGTGNSSLR